MSLLPSSLTDVVSSAHSATNGLMQFLPLIVVFILFWFLILRPQQRKMKQHNAMLASLGKGAKVLTSGGLVGKITKVEDGFIDLEIAPSVVVTLQRSAISAILDK